MVANWKNEILQLNPELLIVRQHYFAEHSPNKVGCFGNTCTCRSI